jgi:hypothetical protein
MVNQQQRMLPQPPNVPDPKQRGRRLAALAVGAALVIAGIVLAVARQGSTSSDASPCGDLHVALVTPTSYQQLPVQAMQRFTLDVRVGDTVFVDASGDCAGTVSGSPENSSVLRWLNRTNFTAAEPGTSELAITMPMCAGSGPTCRGGIFDIARVTVVVSSA